MPGPTALRGPLLSALVCRGGAVTDVTKKITVNVLTETNAAYQDGGSTDYSSVNAQTINLPSSGTISELNAERIRPDKYELVYSFADFDGSIVSIKDR